jgi:ABC-type glycerol-3-phosphate transport system substrate-binding protein
MRAKWYAPLDPLIRSDATAPDWDFADFFPNIVKIHNFGGEQIGVPITIELQALFCNKSMLAAKQLAPPATLDALMDAATKLKDTSNDVAGVVTRGDGVQAVYTFSPFLFAFGGRWQDDKGNPEIGSAAGVKALKYYGDLLRAAGPPNILGMQWKTTYPLFQQARAAMFIDATNFLAYFKDPSQSRVVDQVVVAPLPAGPSGAHSTVISWGPAIAASSKQQAATWTAIQWLTSKKMMVSSTEATHLPPSRQSIYNSDVYTRAVPEDMIRATKEEIPNAVPNGANPLVVPVPEVRSAIGQAIVAVLQGGDAEKAANAAQKQVMQILNGLRGRGSRQNPGALTRRYAPTFPATRERCCTRHAVASLPPRAPCHGAGDGVSAALSRLHEPASLVDGGVRTAALHRNAQLPRAGGR